MKVLFCTSPIGLGHAARDIAILDALRREASFDAVFLSGFPASRLIADYGQLVYDLYDPPSFEVREGRLTHVGEWTLRYMSYYRRCKRIVDEVIRKERPHLIFSDEDPAAVAIARKRQIPAIFMIDFLQLDLQGGIARKVLGKLLNHFFRRFLEGCPLVLIPDEGLDRNNLRFVGPITRQITESRERLREKFGFTKPTILVTVGGTDAGAFLIDRVISTLSNMSVGLEFVAVTGPSIQRARYTSSRVRILGYVPNLHEMIYASDLVVTLAGKSTIDEVRAAGTPFIAIPIANHFEQEHNAARVGFAPSAIQDLEGLISTKLSEPRRSMVPTNVNRCLEAILSFAARWRSGDERDLPIGTAEPLTGSCRA